LALTSGSQPAVASVVSRIDCCGDFFAVHFEFLACRACRRYGEPHDNVADDEDAEQVAHHRSRPVHERNPVQEAQQDRQEHAQPDPYGIDVEVLADAGAYAAQFGVLRVAVKAARDTRLFGGFFVRTLLGDVLDRAHLVDDIQDQGFLDHAGVVLRREDQLGYAGFDVGDDLRLRRAYPCRSFSDCRDSSPAPGRHRRPS